MSTETITVGSDVMTLDLILWRRFKRHHVGLAERVYALNPGLAAKGPILPVGTTFEIPLDAPTINPVRKPLIRLWG